MVNQKDILAALQSGANAQDLAQQFADALNGAIAEQKAAEAAAAEKAQKDARKEVALQGIMDEFVDFIADYYPDFAIPAEAKADLNAAALIEIMDQAAAELAPLIAMANTIGKSDNVNVKFKKLDNAPAGKADAIAEFLRQNGLA